MLAANIQPYSKKKERNKQSGWNYFDYNLFAEVAGTHQFWVGGKQKSTEEIAGRKRKLKVKSSNCSIFDLALR